MQEGEEPWKKNLSATRMLSFGCINIQSIQTYSYVHTYTCAMDMNIYPTDRDDHIYIYIYRYISTIYISSHLSHPRFCCVIEERELRAPTTAAARSICS